MATMRTAKAPISQLIVDQLAHGEMRMLVLVVALRKTLGASAHIKGDLSSIVVVALRKLIASKALVHPLILSESFESSSICRCR